MRTIKGPAIFLAQYLGDAAPFDSLPHLAQWAAGHGYAALQIPTDPRLIDLQQAATSQAYCDDLLGMLESYGLQISELSTHLQGQLVAVHPAYDSLFDGFAPAAVRGNPAARTAWAIEQLMLAAQASQRLACARTSPSRARWPGRIYTRGRNGRKA